MNHIDEHTLELFVLGDPLIKKRNNEILSHLNECSGCRAMYNEMRSYYEEVNKEYSDIIIEPTSKEKSLVPRRTIAPYFDSIDPKNEILKKGTQLGVWRRIGRFGTRHPIAGSMFGVTLIAVLAISWNYILKSRENPSYYIYNSRNYRLDVYDSNNKNIWSLPSAYLDSSKQSDDSSDTHETIIADIDGDGKNNLITMVPIGGERELPRTIKVFTSRGDLKTKFVFPSIKTAYNGIYYDAPFSIAGIDTFQTSTHVLNLLVTANDYRSPSFVARLDNKMNVIGTYWHYGIFGAKIVDEFENNKQLLILTGRDDVNDMSANAHTFMAVLDPEKIVGDAECSATFGFGMNTSPAEQYYIRFPSTDIEKAIGKRPGGAGVDKQTNNDALYIHLQWGSETAGMGSFGFDYVFKKNDMSLREVKFVGPTEITYAHLKKDGKVHGTFNEAYLQNLKNSVMYWDGKKWGEKPTRVIYQEKSLSGR